MNYRQTTYIPNILLDSHIKHLSGSELKITLMILRRTLGQKALSGTHTRVQRAWISQRLFMRLTGLSGRAVSSGIASLLRKGMIEVTNEQGKEQTSKSGRRRSSRLLYSCTLVHDSTKKYHGSEKKSVKKLHTIKLNKNKRLYEKTSQQPRRFTDLERYHQIMQERGI